MVLNHIHSCRPEKLYILNKHISKVCIVRIQSRDYRNRKPMQRIRFLWFGLRETRSYNIDESVWYNYVYNIYAKWNLFIKSLFKLLINLWHHKIESKFWATFGFWGNFWATFRVLEQLLSNFLRKLEQLVDSPIKGKRLRKGESGGFSSWAWSTLSGHRLWTHRYVQCISSQRISQWDSLFFRKLSYLLCHSLLWMTLVSLLFHRSNVQFLAPLLAAPPQASARSQKEIFVFSAHFCTKDMKSYFHHSFPSS